MEECRTDLISNEQDLLIARLKAEAYELTQKVRDYDMLNQEYLALQAKFASLASDYQKNKSGLASHQDHQQNVAYFMKKSHDENEEILSNLDRQREQNNVDSIGLKKSGDAKMRMMHTLKQ